MRKGRATLVLAVLVMGAAPAAAYEPDFINMRVPSQLEQGDLDLLFEHRFYGSVLDNPLQNLFGLQIGANVGFGARYMILPGLQAQFLYTTGGQDLSVGAGYGAWFKGLPFGVQADVELDSPLAAAGRAYSVFATVSAESVTLLKALTLSAEAGYDSYLNHLGAAVGVRVDMVPDLLALVGEVYPFFLLGGEQHPEDLGVTTAFSAGVMLSIGGHQFSLVAGNSYAMGDRQLMAGAPPTGGIYQGFNIQRRFPQRAAGWERSEARNERKEDGRPGGEGRGEQWPSGAVPA